MRNHSPSAAGADPRRRSRCQTMSDRPCNGGHGVTGAAKRWRCAAGSCWPAPRACRTWRSASTWGCIRPRSPNGAAGSPPAALRASATSRGRGCPARSPTSRSSRSSSRPWRRPPPTPPTGTTNLYAALNLASGLVISQMTPRHRAIEFRRFLDRVDQAVPAWLDVHVICEDSSTHKTPAIRRWLVAHPRFHVHFTPTYSSWLNLVERWFSELTTKWLKRGSHRSVPELTASIQSWIDTWNEQPRPFVWHKTADQILDSIARYLQPISNSEH